MAAIVPKGFEIVPNERLPDAPGLEGWQADSPTAADIAPGDHKIGTTNDGKELFRKVLPDGTSFEGYYDDDGQWTGYAEISGDASEPLSLEDQEALPSPPKGFFYDELGQLAPEDTEEAAPEDEYNLPSIGTGGAAYRGATSGLMAGFDDEFKGGVAALANAAGRAVGLNETDPELSIGDLYRHFRNKELDEKDAAFDQHPFAYGAGFLPGALLSSPLIAGKVGAGTKGLAVAGAREGAVSGAGNAEGDLFDRAEGAVEGGAVGAVAAPVIAPVANAVVDPIVQRGARILGNLRERIAGRAPQVTDSGLEALAARSTQDPATMRSEQQEMIRAGVDPRLLDVINEEGRAVVRNASNKMTPAREDLRRHAEDVYAELPDRVARQARENISQAPGTARQLGYDIAEEQRLMGPRFDAVRNEPVALTPDIIRAFSTADARSALRRIGRQMTAEEQQQLNRFIASVNTAQRQIDPRLPPAVREQIESQLFQDSPLTVDIADKFSRVLTKAAEDQPALMRVAQDYANTVRGAARQQYPDYDAALTEMAGRAAVGEAASGTGRFGNNTSEFLSSPPDEYARTTAKAVREPRAGGAGRVDNTPAKGSAEIRPSPDGGAGELVYYTPDGRTVRGRARDMGDGRYEIDVDYLYSPDGDELLPNDLGPALIRDMSRALRDLGVRQVQGSRISGARSGTPKQDEMVSVQIPSRQARPTTSEHDALRMRARDDVVDRATAGSGAQAPGVARQLSRPGIAQADRSRALLGDEGAGRLQRGMGAEFRRYQNTEDIDPRRGSKTASVIGDEQSLAGGVVDAGLNAGSGGKWAAVRSVSNYLRTIGLRNVDAERLVRDAINPRRTNDAINYLTRRGMERARARSLVRSITANAGGRIGGALSYDGSPEGPGRARSSVRSIGNAAGRIDNEQGEEQ